MLLNKKYLLFTGVIALLAFASCDKKTYDPVKIQNSAANHSAKEALFNDVQKKFGAETRFAIKGKFLADSSEYVVAGFEKQGKGQFGIEFALLNGSSSEFSINFKTATLNGSFDKCKAQKIKFPSFNYEFVYYNSQSYFLGASEGEVFSYIIDLKTRNVYSAHLFFTANIKASLFLSKNISSPDIKNFFIGIFKKDFPALKIVSKDHSLD